MFDGEANKVMCFVTVCKLYLDEDKGGRSGGTSSIDSDIYVGRIVDVWKENVLKDLEAGELMFTSAGDFLAEFRKKFRGDNELANIAELKQLNKIYRLWMNLSRCLKKQHKIVDMREGH